MKEKGFVYILTNPSFRENWVKIGMSARPVDIRSKELDNTAVPLPFEIYATVQTEKYAEIEKKLHKILTDLADARIRKNREFFNITPEEAFTYLKMLADLTGDAIINAPDEIDEAVTDLLTPMNKKPIKYTVNTDKLFSLDNGVSKAVMHIIDGNKFVVHEGAILDPVISSNVKTIQRLRNANADAINTDNYTTIKDTVFESPSAAACFVRGGACNGKTYWRDSDDNPLKDYVTYK